MKENFSETKQNNLYNILHLHVTPTTDLSGTNIAAGTTSLFSLNRRQKSITFFFLFLTSLLVYRNCYDIRIPTDSFSFLLIVKNYGVSGLLHNYYSIGLALVADTVFLLGYNLFGSSTIGWFLSAMFFHSLNALLILLISLRLFVSFSVPGNFTLALFAALLFLLSPYQTEVLLWTPRIINYVIAGTFILLSVYYMIKYSQNEKRTDLILFHVSFILATLSFETSLSFPAIPACYFILYRFIHRQSLKIKNILLNIVLPQAIILFMYFLTCKLWLGNWILHYGAKIHLDFSFSLAMGNTIKYLAKFFLLYRYLPASRHEFLHDILHTDISNNYTIWLFAVATISLTGFLFYRSFSINKQNATLLLFLFLAFLIMLIPVINLDTTFLGAVFSDRYGYLPSTFFYLFLSVFIYLLFKKAGGYVCAGLLIVNFVCLSATIPLWNEASDYSKRLIHNFIPHMSEQNIYVLNMPDNYNWIMTYRNGFASTSEFIYEKKLKHLNEISGFYMTSPGDSVKVTRNDSLSFLVESMPARKSFLSKGTWAKSYETDSYSVSFSENLSSFTITFKDKIPDNAAMFYVAGDQWRKVKVR
ncbi:MAG: hypothetical protein EPN85_03765 [Bacteroidetes bacterium]|nr:MAG: hypothetical protein EPN85_03765 [Bacteroidota bacterium]